MWNTKLKNLWFLVASIIFYSWGAPTFVFILLASTILDFYVVQSMYKSLESGRKKKLLIFSICINLALLAYFKYANFFVENIQAFLGTMGSDGFSWETVVLPIGISFYTFQTLTYSIDIYRGISKPLDRLTDYILYIIMFPQLIAGPIVRYNLVAEQMSFRQGKYADKLNGFFRFSIGLAKKVIIANGIGAVIDPYFTQLDTLNSGMSWLVIFAYSFQIYFDFSGYSDMAIGLGKVLGFRFPENFNSPYISKSITEFWRRWHITLGEWMRDYLYIPLGGNRVDSTARLYFNLWIVFVISGLWHGASWNFVIWGIIHGMFLILDRLFLLDILKRLGHFAVVVNFIIVALSWVVFRIETLADARVFYNNLFSFDDVQIPYIGGGFYYIMLLAILISFARMIPSAKRVENWLLTTPKMLTGSIAQFLLTWFLVLVCVAELATSDFNPFIYFRF